MKDKTITRVLGVVTVVLSCMSVYYIGKSLVAYGKLQALLEMGVCS